MAPSSLVVRNALDWTASAGLPYLTDATGKVCHAQPFITKMFERVLLEALPSVWLHPRTGIFTPASSKAGTTQKGERMADVPTPDDVAEEAEEGNEPTSLGDVATGLPNDSVRDDEIVPDRRDPSQS